MSSLTLESHLQEVRSRVHKMAKNALRPGGLFILEAYTPRQIAFGTGLVLGT